MTTHQKDFAVHLSEAQPGLWNWRVIAPDGQIALTGAATAQASAFEQADLFRRYLSRFGAEDATPVRPDPANRVRLRCVRSR